MVIIHGDHPSTSSKVSSCPFVQVRYSTLPKLRTGTNIPFSGRRPRANGELSTRTTSWHRRRKAISPSFVGNHPKYVVLHYWVYHGLPHYYDITVGL